MIKILIPLILATSSIAHTEIEGYEKHVEHEIAVARIDYCDAILFDEAFSKLDQHFKNMIIHYELVALKDYLQRQLD